MKGKKLSPKSFREIRVIRGGFLLFQICGYLRQSAAKPMKNARHAAGI